MARRSPNDPACPSRICCCSLRSPRLPWRWASRYCGVPGSVYSAWLAFSIGLGSAGAAGTDAAHGPARARTPLVSLAGLLHRGGDPGVSRRLVAAPAGIACAALRLAGGATRLHRRSRHWPRGSTAVPCRSPCCCRRSTHLRPSSATSTPRAASAPWPNCRGRSCCSISGPPGARPAARDAHALEVATRARR